MYQLQYLFDVLVLIRYRNREKSCSRLACQAVRVHDFEMVDFSDFCNPNSHMLGAESVKDPKIKVVPYVKHYNFALVNSSMQGL